MASAVLANRNEPSWSQPQPRGVGAKFMGKVPFSNPNPNSKFSKKRQFQPAAPALNFDIPPAAAVDDASSINRRPGAVSGSEFNSGGYVTFNIGSCTKKQLLELKNQLVAELDQIRQLKNRINSSQSAQIRSTSNFNKKQPKKGILGNKRPLSGVSNYGGFVAKDVKRSNLYNHPENVQLMKKCGQILSKLMKPKFGYIFNSPVDVQGLNLHDYFDIIKHPMDLGTVKKKMAENAYDSPVDFAADVRLTFSNAMKYNPKGHDVYTYAEQLLLRFEELFRPIRDRLGDLYEDQDQDHVYDDRDHEIEIEHEQVHEVQASSWDHHNLNRSGLGSDGGGSGGEIERIKQDPENVTHMMANSEQAFVKPIPPSALPSNPQSTSQLPVRTPSPLRAPPVKHLKQPKPKARDPNKREMTLEEKHKLGLGLQSLPQEKMDQVVQIIKRRNEHLRQDGDEIELDIEAVDKETLWDLDRFVTNYKKMASKMKRQQLMGIPLPGAAVNDDNKDLSGNERVDITMEAKKPKKGDVGDEDVDIGDEMPMSSFPPVEIEKDNGHASSSSSSSSSSSDGSSSSSDSDSGSSSGSDSEDAQS
ncbi:transcription factor GTE7-like [Mercurialis annua]|uniref:transcription factor GTE7-like n=1 Tax=Mercurialis annua TaxID=3986 RepID=UPI00215FD27F|nr:transcription factor GTE7-like [Mercurialis annua]